MDSRVVALALAAVTIGAVHAASPDHWVPFATLARARSWSAARTARITVLCGLGHVTVSVLLGLLGLVFGMGVLEAFGHRMEAIAGVLLTAFGLGYGAWHLRRAAGRRVHGHTHRHYDHVHDEPATTAWMLFLLFSADPCVAVIPLLFAAAPLGAASTIAVVALYELATIATMVLFVLPARAGATRCRFAWLERYGDTSAGALIAAVGVVVMYVGW